MEIGDLVRHKGLDKKMTVMRLLGDEENSSFTINDRRMGSKGFSIGDPTCMWFDDTQLRYSLFKSSDLEILIYEEPNTGGTTAAIGGAGGLMMMILTI